MAIDRVACYIRVSTQEQKIHGISLDAQRDKLNDYASTHNLRIVAWYEDEGISGRKPIKQRPALQRMLLDSQAKKFDRIIFIKLDRFFRSVAEYHECMKKLDPVVWTATEEKYDLATANGRAFVNMKLTIAELEADQTGERIKLVNEYKIKSGTAVTGATNYAFKVVNKHVVQDSEHAPVVRDAIQYFLTHQSKHATLKYINEKYNCNLSYWSLTTVLTDSKLYGFYRGNPDYCEPYTDKATYDKIQDILSKNVKKTPTGRIFLFAGLLKCPSCGRKLSGVANSTSTYTYRCNNAYKDARCSFNRTKAQSIIERYLLDNLNELLTDHIRIISVEDARTSNELSVDNQIAALKKEMKLTTSAYIKGRLTEREYDSSYARLEADVDRLEALKTPPVQRDLSAYEQILNGGWRSIYDALTAENKQAFWRQIIKEIRIDNSFNVTDVIFF